MLYTVTCDAMVLRARWKYRNRRRATSIADAKGYMPKCKTKYFLQDNSFL